MSTFWKDYIFEALVPDFLNGPNGRSFLEAIADEKDSLRDEVIDAIKLREPSQCDPSAYQSHALTRVLPWIDGESPSQTAERLASAFSIKTGSGTSRGIIDSLKPFNIGNRLSPLGMPTVISKKQRDFSLSWDFERFGASHPSLNTWCASFGAGKKIANAESAGLIVNGYLPYLKVCFRPFQNSFTFTQDDVLFAINSSTYCYFKASADAIVWRVNGVEVSSAFNWVAGNLVTVKVTHNATSMTLSVDGGGVVSRASPGPIVEWTPQQIPQLLACYDADIGIALNGSAVAAWADSGGSGDEGRNSSQTTAVYQPPYTPNNASFNGHASITFSAAQVLNTGTWSSSQSVTTDFYVVRCPSTSSSYYNLVDGFGASDRHSFSYGPGQAVSMYAGGQVVSSAVATGTIAIICAEFNGANSRIYLNNSSTPIASGNCGAQAFNRLALGNYQGGYPFLGDVALMAICNGTLTAAQRAEVMQALGRYYGHEVT